MDYKPRGTECSTKGCGNARRKGQRLCSKCHAEYMKRFRSERVYVKRADMESSQ